MRILVITSCTGQKSQETPETPEGLTCDDFARGARHVKAKEKALKALMTPAEDLYTGQQHVRLMRAARTAREKFDVDIRVVSAGYGVVRGNRKLAPYECTFTGRGKANLRAWADQLKIPEHFRVAVSEPFDLGLLLLGDDYLTACDLQADIRLGGPVIALCGRNSIKRLPAIAGLKPVGLSNAEAKRFSCGLVGLKGEIAARLLSRLVEDPTELNSFIDPALDLLDLLDHSPSRIKAAKAKANPKVDSVIHLPASWRNKPHRDKLRYFIPEWDDLVDPDYDFEHDIHSGGIGDWSNEVYAHQMYPEPNYDGILVSRAVAEKSKKKNARINELGVHRFLRVPRDFPIMGDCGAFDYIEQDEPPYTTDDVIDYYTRLDFDYGVSVDHLVVPAFEAQKHQRYELTIHNAEEFLREHRRHGLNWEPIGAVQGWDIKRYVEAARKYVAMGYRYIALGGLVRSQTTEILATVQAVREAIPADVQIHVFGFSRFDAIRDLIKAGANSVDSASMLRKAWLGANLNYLTPAGWYPAIRIPQAGGSFRAKRLIQEGKATLAQLERLERDCLRELRAFASRRGEPSEVLINHLVEYDTLVAGERAGTAQRLRRTLEDRPWEQCDCAICRQWGVEVVIFRGNNRNRRRGFHNTYVFYRLMQDMSNGTRRSLEGETDPQLALPIHELVAGA
jgi:queuine/archaeosine tRNA-ribosyltransferase